ncbi:MAG: hemagglutinin repeat-containing protein, partial [Serratia marcescens]|nr:hemagglutinin repeat-containing protein [Serratia marcescens]MDU7865543.1 hemagglutinin repeat-containing protein [Serratia marcescens]
MCSVTRWRRRYWRTDLHWHENGNGLTHTETTLDTGSNLKVTSGRDTRLTGAQASGEKVTVDVGRDLT